MCIVITYLAIFYLKSCRLSIDSFLIVVFDFLNVISGAKSNVLSRLIDQTVIYSFTTSNIFWSTSQFGT